MGEIGCAVERIYNPSMVRVQLAVIIFFSQDIVTWEVLADMPDNQRFRLAVSFGHQIIFTLELDTDATFEVLHEKGTGFTSRFNNQVFHLSSGLHAVSSTVESRAVSPSCLTNPVSSHHRRVTPITASGMQSICKNGIARSAITPHDKPSMRNLRAKI